MKYDVTTLNNKDTISLEEISKEMGISMRLVYKLVKTPNFPVIKLSQRRLVIYKEFFHKWLNEMQINKDTSIFNSK